jgi:hypothetical protein
MVDRRRPEKERTMTTVRTITASIAAMLALAAALPGTAAASGSIESFDVYTSTTQAGGHPDLEAVLAIGDPGDPESAKDIAVNLPQGVFGNPSAALKCSSQDFALAQCPTDSQIGLITLRANYLGDANYLLGTAPVFNMASESPDETAHFAFITPVVGIPINIPIKVRTATDYGLRMTVTGISQRIPLAATDLRVWGIPASEEHDFNRFLRGSVGSPAGCPGEATAGCASNNGTVAHPSGLLPAPLADNPTVCTGKELPVSIDVTTYQDPGHPSHAEDVYPATTGCFNETFDPAFSVALTSERSDSASGLEMQMKASQFLGFANSPSTIRSANLILPEGISINPDAADGQQACTDDQANFDSEGRDECPDSAKIGNFDIETPALDGPLTGSLYIGEPKPGNQYRAFLIASGFGINSKIVASFHPDPRTGQLTISVVDLPQVPFEKFNLHLFASDRGLVSTPTRCSVYQADSIFIPWNASLAPQHSKPTLSVTSGPYGGPCPGQVRPFNPSLVAGMSNPVAGAFSAFTLKLDRIDGDQFLGDLNFRMPPGFTGDLRGVAYCPEPAILAAAANLGRTEQVLPSCPQSSLIGTTNVAAGPGGHPFHAIGKMYLAGPFKGAPLSVAAITPALAGPYDYGVVVVRVALHVDPLTAQVTAASDKVPSIIGGIPIRMRSIQVNIDKPNFTINPTNCSAFSIDSQGIGDEGTIADFSSYFHAVNCFALPFKPQMTIRLSGGRKATRRSQNPALQFDLRTRPGDANIKALTVTLPPAFAIDQRHLGNICSEKELAATRCAGRTPIGKASTATPLLDQPLSGPVYAVSGSGGLPKLAFILDGQVDLVPRAETKSIATKTGAGRLSTTVPVVPDAPIGHFSLAVFGGKTGYLVNTRDLCFKAPVTRISYTGQNSKTHTENVKVKAACGGKKSKRARHRRHAR